MHRMTILYGMPDDPEHFRRYYDEVHIPLARKMPGLTGWNLSWLDVPTSSADTTGSADEGWFLVAELYTADREAMTAMLDSPEGQAASADLDNFVTGGVVFLTGDEIQVPLR